MTQTKVGIRKKVLPSLSYLLDTYTGAAAAYSLRKLNSNYTGYALRVRRSSDNTTLDVGFDANGDLDTTALLNFVGSGSGFVSIWYDQSGNGYDRSSTTLVYQPQIISAGNLITSSGKPSIYFDGTNDQFIQQGPTLPGVSTTIFSVFEINNSYSTTIEYPLFGGTSWYGTRFSINNNKYFMIDNTTNSGISSVDNITTGVKVTSTLFSTTDKMRVNGVEVLSGNAGNSGSGSTYIGRSYLGKFWYGNISEMIIYTSDKTSNISGIESSINSFYSIY